MKGVRRQRRGARVVKDHRASGIRLPDLPETHPDFVAAWAAAEASLTGPAALARRSPVAAGTLAAAIRAEKASRPFAELSSLYQSILRKDFDAMEAAYGTAPLKGLRSRHIAADLDKLSADAANKRLKAWRRVMGGARRRGEIESDPSIEVRRIKVKTEGFPAWTQDEVEKFRARWPIGTVQRACFELVCWTGARTNDAVRLGLRKYRLTAIAEAGGSAHAIMAWGGHQTLVEAEHYTRAADRRRLVMGAEQGGNVVSPRSPDTKTAKK